MEFTKEQLIERINNQIDIEATIIERLGDDSAAVSELAVKTATMDMEILDIAMKAITDGDKLAAADKRIAELEAQRFSFSDSKLLSLAKDIVENLVDTGASDPEYTQQYVDWTSKRIRAAGIGKGE